MEAIKTFKDLYEILIAYNTEEFKSLLSIPPNGKDIQESCLRLFAKLKCIGELDEYNVCVGNFNLSTFKPIASDYDIFYSNNKLICLKDNGDASDLTLLNEDKNHVLAFTSKNVKKIDLPKLDIDKISFNHDSKYRLKIGICVPSTKVFQKAVLGARKTTLTDNMLKHLNAAIVIDHLDLMKSFSVFITKYKNISFDQLIRNALQAIQIIYRPHQIYTIEKSVLYINKYAKQEKYANILWGHIARSGKSYMMNGLIERLDDLGDESNYLIITTAPNETIEQYIQIMSILKVRGFNLITSKTELETLSGKNVIILSKQLLTNNSNKELLIPNVEVVMIDEAHHGGTTDLSKSLLDKYSECHKIFITATYEKISYGFRIDKTLKWDLEDIELVKTEQYDLLDQKYPKFSYAINEYKQLTDEKILGYSKYPKLCITGLDLSNDDRMAINGDEDNWTWSMNTLFELKSKKLRYIHSVDSIFRYILHDVISKVDAANATVGQRLILDPTSPSVIMCFLPSNNINMLSQLIKSVLNRIDDAFEVCICNTKDTSLDIKSNIERSLITAGNKNKKAVIALTGTQGHLGVTIDKCDLVLLMNNSKSMDYMYQSMFRCMTEAETKQFGHVIDFDIDRSLLNVAEYGKFISNKTITSKEALEKVISNGIINLTFSEDFEFYDKSKMLKNILKRYNKSDISNIDHYLKRLLSYDIKLTSDQLNKIGGFLIKTVNSKTKAHDDNAENDTVRLKTPSCKKESDATLQSSSKEDKASYMNTLKHLIPIACMLTINQPHLCDYSSMINNIVLNKELYSILKEQFKIWWKKEMSQEQFTALNLLFEELELNKNDEIDSIISTIKQLFVECKNDRDQLSKHIDKYLIPAIEERNSNAEVSTPYSLRQEMLNTLPLEFWASVKKVFEPCCGKGGFVIDIFNKFKASGLDDKTIIEECIYFADINPLNVFITTLLLDPEGKYQINSFLGDTLDMKFEIEFDAVIGNPPYNANQTSQGNTPIYNKFVDVLIDKTQYLLFVIPSRWFSGGKGLDKFRAHMISRTDLSLIRHIDNSKEWFDDVDIEGGVCYFLKDSSYCGECMFNGHIYDLKKYDIIADPKCHALVDSVKSFASISGIYRSAGHFKVRTNDFRLKPSGSVECFVSLKKSSSRLMYVDDYNIADEKVFWKVITPEANGKKKCFGAIFVGAPKQIYTDSYISFKVESVEEANSLKSYLETQFANLMLSFRKISQHITFEMIKWIPLVPFDREWTDDLVYEYFEFDEDQVKLIQSFGKFR